MGDFFKPQQTGTAQSPGQSLLADLLTRTIGGQLGTERGPITSGPLAGRGIPGKERIRAPGSFQELVDLFGFQGPATAGPTAIQRQAVGAGGEALGELQPVFAGLRDLAMTGGGLDPSGLTELERQASNLRGGFGQRGTRLSRGAAAGEGLLRSETLANLQGQALDRRLQASQLATTAPFAAAGSAFQLGEGLRGIADQEILRRMSEFGDIRNLIFGGATGGTPIVSESGFGQAQGAAGTAAGIASLLKLASDAALKTSIRTIPGALERLSELRGVEFDWIARHSDKHDGGVVAQDVESVFPEFVYQHAGIRHVSYTGLMGAMIEAIKELKTRVEALEN